MDDRMNLGNPQTQGWRTKQDLERGWRIDSRVKIVMRIYPPH